MVIPLYRTISIHWVQHTIPTIFIYKIIRNSVFIILLVQTKFHKTVFTDGLNNRQIIFCKPSSAITYLLLYFYNFPFFFTVYLLKLIFDRIGDFLYFLLCNYSTYLPTIGIDKIIQKSLLMILQTKFHNTVFTDGRNNRQIISAVSLVYTYR